MHDNNDVFALRQELFDDAPPECTDPNYAEVLMERACAGIAGSAWCVVASCGTGTKLDPDVYHYVEYRGGDDNDPNVGRKVCD
jgi:hypothetical protein